MFSFLRKLFSRKTPEPQINKPRSMTDKELIELVERTGVEHERAISARDGIWELNKNGKLRLEVPSKKVANNRPSSASSSFTPLPAYEDPYVGHDISPALVLAASILSNSSVDNTPSAPSYEGHGGSSGGAGASASWDSTPSSNYSTDHSSYDSSSSSSYDSGSSYSSSDSSSSFDSSSW